MSPPSGKQYGRSIAALTLAAVALAVGAYGWGPQRAQVGGAPELCIEVMGPYYREGGTLFSGGLSGFRKDSLASFSDGVHFVKTVIVTDINLYSVDEAGTITLASQVPGSYTNGAATVLGGTELVVAYFSGGKAYVRTGTLNGNNVIMGQAVELATVGSGESATFFAIDAISDTKFVVVTNLTTTPSPSTALKARIGTVSPGGAGSVTVSWDTPLSTVPQAGGYAGGNFDVAGAASNKFIVAYADSTAGGAYIRGTLNGAALSFGTKHALGTQVSGIDVASSPAHKVAMAYRTGNGGIQAGEIIFSGNNESFGPINVVPNGAVATAVAWVNDATYIVGTAGGETSIYEGAAGSSLLGARIVVQREQDVRTMSLSGLAGHRALIAQAGFDTMASGITATLCPDCGNGIEEPGEQCDDGNDIDTDACSNACELPGEACLNNNDPLCDPRFCPNGELDPGEQCDSQIPGWENRCDPLCRIICSDDSQCPSGECAGGICTNLCGNGIVDPEICVGDACSQAEQCDEGCFNGEPGKCTIRCTYCGNGVIDTVNGVPEQCDEGDQNGVPGSGCSVQCTTGPGPEHLACIGLNQCAIVSGSGPDQCGIPSDCNCLPSDPTCTHAACSNGACAQAAGPGAPQCDSNDDCTPCPAGNPLCHEQCNYIAEQCVAADLGQCNGDCHVDDAHLICQSDQCVMTLGPGPNECDSIADCASGQQHLECVGLNQCAIVSGPGPDACGGSADCACLPSDPTCTHAACSNGACAQAAGPGAPQCNSNDDCTPCPASNPLCHEQCDYVAAQCTAAGLGACIDDCGVTNPTHLECQNNACALINGPGPDQCASAADCLPIQHLACVGVGSCSLVQGPGPNSCFAPSDCCDPNDPSCNHGTCTGVGSCSVSPGPGPNACDTGSDCTCDPNDPSCVRPVCDYLAVDCTTTSGGGDPMCSTDNDCDGFHTACIDSACTLVAGSGPNDCDEVADCALPLCGNGTIDTVNGVTEACDEGDRNRSTPPDDLTQWYCKTGSCLRSECFDGFDNDLDQLPDIVDAGCWRYPPRRGPQGGGTSPFLSFLLLAQAGDPPIDPVMPEAYLPGKLDENCPIDMVDRGSFCAMTCDAGEICPGGEVCPDDGVCPILCGNGAIDQDEDCDDGNLTDDDLCNNRCHLNPCTGANCPYCGDGIHQPQIGEQCDGNDPPSVGATSCTENCRIFCTSDDQCTGTCDESTNQCLPPQCGDGNVNQDWERCDDGNVNNEDDCNNACQPTCNIDADCESGRCDQAQQVCVPSCGNGHMDSGEQCDDGNTIDGDACNNSCRMRCDDDSTCDCDEETNLCRRLCGNGRIDAGERCDDGNTNDRDQCSNTCKVRCRLGTLCPDSQACPQNGECPVPAVCGDGLVNDLEEQCDDGNTIDGDACSNSCRLRCEQNAECPSGLLCQGQQCVECINSLQCDNGFCVDGRCRAALPICGNGLLEPGEVCDDANADESDGCTSGCFFPTNHACIASSQCQTKLCQGNVCTPCTSADQCGSGLRCAEGNCLFGSLQCGDGVMQAGEACDDANFNEQDQCTTACLLSFGQACSHASQCASTICASGICTPCRSDAECGSGTRCAIGLCLTDAQMSMLPNICGNGRLERGEACDDGNARYGDGCTPTCDIGNAPLRAEVAADVTIQMPFRPDGSQLHAGAGNGLSDTGPATVAVMAAGAAAGTAWVRRRFSKKKA